MPHPRPVSIVLCSCGWRCGNSQRASLHEDMEAAEHALIAAEVPRMVRHFELDHDLRLGESAPRSFLAVIAQVAAQVAKEPAPVAPAAPLYLPPAETT